MQNSFLPYGVFNTNPNVKNGDDPRWRYWNLAAYKVGQEDVPLGQRMGGITQWSWTQFIQQWASMFKKSNNSSINEIVNYNIPSRNDLNKIDEIEESN